MKSFRLLLSLLLAPCCLLAQVPRATDTATNRVLTVTEKFLLPSKADPGTPTALEIWISTTNADTLKYRSNGTTYSLVTAAGLNAYFADPSSNGSFSASAWKSDLGLATSTTDNAIARFDSTAGNTQNSAVTIADTTGRLGVPDGWGVDSAGSIDLIAGGSNKSITFKTSGTGSYIFNQNAGSPPTPFAQGIQLVGADATQTVIGLDVFGGNARYITRRANGTAASPSAVASNDALLQMVARGYGATGYTAGQGGMVIRAAQTFTDSASGISLEFYVTPLNSTTTFAPLNIDNNGAVRAGAARTIPAWGANGIFFRTQTDTITDSSSSGTVSATTVFNSFAVPTLNSTSSTTYSGFLANVYIAGDPAVTGNASLSGLSFGLYNVGKTKLEGRVYIGTATGTNLLVGTSTNSSNGSIQLADHTTSAGGIGFGAGSNSLYTSASGTLFWNGNKITAARAADTSQTLTIDGGDGSGIYLTAAGTKNFFITGAAGNTTITAGTGNSRTLTLQTTTSGGTATTALLLDNAQNATFTGWATVGSSSGLGWNTRSRMKSPSDGVMTMYDSAETSFNRLQFGGTTSSYPSLKRSSAALVVRLADDSADAAITASTITTAAGVAWNLGAYTAGAPTPDGYITVSIAGSTYRISADLQ